MRRWLPGGRRLLLLLLWPVLLCSLQAQADSGRIVYDVHYGAQGFKVGEAEHRWQFEQGAPGAPGRYVLELNLQATGLAGLFGLEYEQRSEGRLGKEGLQPEQFLSIQRGRKPERVTLDWRAAEVRFYRGERLRRSAPLLGGEQDVLSLWHQARRLLSDKAGSSPEHPERPLRVLTGKRLKEASLKVLGKTAVKLPAGTFDSLHVLAEADDGGLQIELWLGLAESGLPLRIRLTNEDGQVLDQRATAITAGAQPVSVTGSKH